MDIYLEYRDAKSAKFWHITRRGKSYTVRYGRIGAEGKTQEKTFASPAEAEMHALKLLESKKKKGYVSARRPSAKAKEKPTSTKAKAKGSARAVVKKAAASRKPASDWEALLMRWSELVDDDDDVDLDEAPWAARRAATDAAVGKAEGRLGCELPPSYRSFLKVSNGWRGVGPWMLYPDHLLPAGKVGWFKKKSPRSLKAWAEEGDGVTKKQHLVYDDGQDVARFHVPYLERCLQVSDDGEGGVFLLNPDVVHRGEWEAWHLAAYHPGAIRYRSFRALCEALVEEYGSWR